jgi:hypothetical protein
MGSWSEWSVPPTTNVTAEAIRAHGHVAQRYLLSGQHRSDVTTFHFTSNHRRGKTGSDGLGLDEPPRRANT